MATEDQVYQEAVAFHTEHLAKQKEVGLASLSTGDLQAHLNAAAASSLRAMQDAVTWQNISPSVPLVAGYDDGIYAWPGSAWNTFSGRGQRLVHIVISAGHNFGQVLDCEQGDATPSQCPGWVAMRRRSGLAQPTVYCSLAVWGQVQNAFNAAGVAHPDWWIAAYPGIGAALYGGSIAHQYADPGPVDLSVVAPYWSAVDGGAPPPPAPPPPPPTDDAEVVSFTTQLLGGQL